jgi:hypothetical protein
MVFWKPISISLLLALGTNHGVSESVVNDRPSFASLPLELDLGASYGLSSSALEQQANVASVVRGAASQQPEYLYLKGLLHLYGHGGMAEDHEKVCEPSDWKRP